MADQPIPPVFPPAEMVYDQIMEAIDPRLKSTELGMLPHRYDEVTPEQREAMLKEFAHSFVQFEKKYAEYHADFRRKIEEYKEEVTLWAKDMHGEKDAKILLQFEKFFENSPSSTPRTPAS